MSVEQTLNNLSNFIEDIVSEVLERNVDKLRSAVVRDIIGSAEFRQLIFRELESNPKYIGPQGIQGNIGSTGATGAVGPKLAPSEILETVQKELEKPKYVGKTGNIGPRGPAGNIEAALNNCSILLDKRFAEFREQIRAEVAAALKPKKNSL